MLGIIQRKLASGFMRLRPVLRAIIPQRLHGTLGYAGRMVVRWLESTSTVSPAGVALLEPARLPSRAPVAIVNSDLSPGGAERQITNLIHGLAARGEALPDVYGLHLNDGERQRFFEKHITEAGAVVRRPMRTVDARRALDDIYGTGAAQRLEESLSWAPADVAEMTLRLAGDFSRSRPAVVHGWQDAPSIAAGLAGLATGVPRIILSGRNLAPDRFTIFRPYMQAAYCFLAAEGRVRLCNNSEAGARDYMRWIGAGARDIRVVRNGVSPGARPASDARIRMRRAWSIPDKALVIGGIMRLAEEKRPMLWLDVVAGIAARRPDVVFVLVGTGPMAARVQARAEALRLSAGQLIIPGLVGADEQAAAAFDLLLLTSTAEGTPNAILEAASAGAPTVASNAGGTAEAVLADITGSVAPHAPDGSAEEVAWLQAACLRWLEDGPGRKRAAREGPAFVASRFGVARMVEEMLSLYGAPDA